MVQLNGVIATITAVTHNTITFGAINSSAYTAFAYPTSAVAALGVQPAIVVPIGEVDNSTAGYLSQATEATYNTSATGVWIGTGVQTSGSTYQWIVRKGVAM
jgi:hypothetical protein